MKNLKIGLTWNGNFNQLWSNGVRLNILFLLKLLQKSSNNYEVCLLTTTQGAIPEPPDHLKDIKIHYVDDKMDEMDLIIIIGAELSSQRVKRFKSKPNKKLVSYVCGNTYLIQALEVLYQPNNDIWYSNELCYDEIWYVPQQYENNHGFFKTLYRTNAIPVPFIWHNECLIKALVGVEKEFKMGNYKKSFSYNPNKEKKVIGVMEPNLNIVKYCMIPTMITEECYRTKVGRERIEKLMLFNSLKISKDKTFLSVLKTFDLFNDGKIRSEGRYQTGYIVSQYLDVVVSHQVFNPLNYLYMDIAYMGYPVLHNAWMCKDLGYYYEGSDVQQGAKKLQWIIENHDSHMQEYAENTKKVLARYSADNPTLVEAYDVLIKNVFEKGGNGNVEYDPTTNLYVS